MFASLIIDHLIVYERFDLFIFYTSCICIFLQAMHNPQCRL